MALVVGVADVVAEDDGGDVAVSEDDDVAVDEGDDVATCDGDGVPAEGLKEPTDGDAGLGLGVGAGQGAPGSAWTSTTF